jgi:hypothetical protein
MSVSLFYSMQFVFQIQDCPVDSKLTVFQLMHFSSHIMLPFEINYINFLSNPRLSNQEERTIGIEYY